MELPGKAQACGRSSRRHPVSHPLANDDAIVREFEQMDDRACALNLRPAKPR